VSRWTFRASSIARTTSNPSINSPLMGHASALNRLQQCWSKLVSAMTFVMRQKFIRSGLAAMLLTTLAFHAPATAQYGSSAITDPNAALADSMRTLAKEPKNMSALIAAGRASLELGDFQAAAGFFGRAEESYPQSPMPKIGMGATMTMSGDPSSALTYFSRASALGAPASMLALDRGMAYDLLGQQSQAQAQYRMAMVGVQADEARRRLALSLAISRDIKGAAATIEPLLARRDPESLRVNAFVLALAGDREGARRTIDAAMPGTGAQFEPFFRLLPVLNPREKAAAVHLGEFPKDAAQRYATAQPIASSPVLSIGNTNQPIVSKPVRTANVQPKNQATKVQPKRVQVAQAPRRAEQQVEPINTWIASVRPSLDPSRFASSRRPKTQAASSSSDKSGGSAADPEPRPVAPAFSVAAAPPPPPTAEPPRADEPAVETIALPASVSDRAENAFADSDSSRDPLSPADSDVDEPAKPGFVMADSPPPAPRPKLEFKTPAASKPKVELASRSTAKPKALAAKESGSDVGTRGTYWVQLAGSGDKTAMSREFRKISAKKPDLFKGHPGHVTVGKDYFRLLVGPFDSASEAHAYVTKLDKAGIDSFTWTRNPAQIKIEKIASK
jgi:Flp pilus assembly protein TadD